MSLPLTGKTIALAEGRQLEDLAGLLHKEGADVYRCPMLSILDAPDPAPVNAWLRDLVAGKFDYVILLTGEGLRRLIAVAEKGNKKDAVVAALGKVSLVTRGPKPGQALKEIALKPTLVASAPTTDGVIATLKHQSLKGKSVAVQLYSESNPPLTDYLAAAGAKVKVVQPYVYAPAADADRVADLINRSANGALDAIVFTSSPQVERVFEVAAERQLAAAWARGIERMKVASVGPIVSDTLRRLGARVDVQPEQGFQMKNLVVHLKRAFAGGA
jgi:uroporphyrinogen-III synthase